MPDRELEDSVEQHPAGAGLAPVEPEGEFVEILLKVLGAGRSLMSARQPSFDQGSDPVHARQQRRYVSSCSLRCELVTRFVRVSALRQTLVAAPPVGDEMSASLDGVRNERFERLARGVRDHLHSAPPVAFAGSAFNRYGNEGLLPASPTAGQAFLASADIGLIDLDPAGKLLPPRAASTLRSRCNIAHAVLYEPISRVRCRLSAETPSLAVANSQQTSNHTVNGVRRRSNSVPAVTAVRLPQL